MKLADHDVTVTCSTKWQPKQISYFGTFLTEAHEDAQSKKKYDLRFPTEMVLLCTVTMAAWVCVTP
jgi:hypothetical protein